MSFKSFALPAPAKLNLFLHVTGRRPDGYHELQTLFQFIDLCDQLEFRPAASGLTEVTPPLPGIEPGANLVWRAAQLLRERTGAPQGISIRVDKRIPEGGGLGGGSSDAATTLLALNHCWNLGLTPDELAGLGLELGADVPVFVRGHAAVAEGVGERLVPVDPETPWYLVIHPGCGVSTAAVFAHRELTRNTPSKKIPPFPSDGLRNDCEQVVRLEYSGVARALDWLSGHGEARLTGTGSCVFAAFGERQDAEAALREVPEAWKGYVVRGMNQSPLVSEMNRLFST